MALSSKLNSVELTFACPHCSHPIVKPASWFKVGPPFKCKKCKTEVRLTYSDKVALFGRHIKQT